MRPSRDLVAERSARKMFLRGAVLPLLERCFKSGGILGYHAIVEDDVPSPEMHVSVGTFRRQLEYIRARYDVIPLRELVHRHTERRPVDGCVAITFDDAYAGVEHLAAPILADLDLTATVFVTVSAAETGAAFWWDELEHARRTSPDVLWPRVLDLLGIARLPPSAAGLAGVRDHILSRHAGLLHGTVIALPAPSNRMLRSMGVDALQRLARDQRFEFGCHTVSHPVLPFLSSEAQHIELVHAQRWLEQMLPRVVPIVAYPFGLYDGRTLAEAARAGFRAGVTMQARALARQDLALALPRTGISEHWSASAISLRLNRGLGPLFKARGGIHPRLPHDSRLRAGGA
jgi:peptidoglycan/xylan/chitin deacetylase (PgdA/CDA1 family)